MNMRRHALSRRLVILPIWGLLLAASCACPSHLVRRTDDNSLVPKCLCPENTKPVRQGKTILRCERFPAAPPGAPPLDRRGRTEIQESVFGHCRPKSGHNCAAGMRCLPEYATRSGALDSFGAGSCVPTECSKCWGEDRQCVLAHQLSTSTWSTEPQYTSITYRGSGWRVIGCGGTIEYDANTRNSSHYRFPYADEYTGMVEGGRIIPCTQQTARPAPCYTPFAN